MSNNPTDKTVLDSFFAIPRGAEEVFTYKSDEVSIGSTSADDDANVLLSEEPITESNEGEEGVDENEVKIRPPESFLIIDQTLRRAPGGQQVVDVTFDIEDVDNAINYEFKVTKT